MFFEIINEEDGINRIQVTLGYMKRRFTVSQFVKKTTRMLNKLGYEVVKK